jgi:HEAT repeat protein
LQIGHFSEGGISVRLILVPVFLLLATVPVFAQTLEELVSRLAEPENASAAVFKLAGKGKEASGPLIKAMSSSDAGVRYHALWALTLIGDKSAGSAALKCLRDADALVRLRAVFAASALAPGEVMPVLERLASDPDVLVRASAATVLSDCKEKMVTDALLKSLELHKNRFSAMALINHGKAAAPGLRKLLGSEDVTVRRMACFALGQIGDKDSLDALTAAANDKNPDIAISAAVALALMHQDEAYSLLTEALRKRGQSAEDVPAILKKLVKALGALKSGTAAEKAKTYAELGKYGFLPPVPELISQLRGKDESGLRAAAAKALGDIGSDLALGALVATSGDRSSAVRLAVAGALGKLAAREGVASLRQLSYDPDPEVRAAAASALAQLDIKDLSPIFKRMSQDPESKVRLAAFQALDIYPPSFGEPIFISLLKKEKNPFAKALLIRLLGRIATENALHIVIKEADSKEVPVRLAAVEALGNFGEQRAGQKLVAALIRVGTVDEKVAAVRALGRNRSELAVPVLVDRLRKPGDELGPVLAETLGDLGAKEAVPVLTQALESATGEFAEAILTALGKIAAPESLPLILAIVRDAGKPVEVRRTAVSALGSFKGSENAKTAAMSFLKEDDLAAEASSALSRLGDDTGLAALGRLLHKLDPGSRLRAVQALRHFDSEEATALLFAAAKDSDSEIALTAALELLSRSKFEALAILQILLAKEESRKKLHKVLKEFEVSQVLHPVMEKLAAAKEHKIKMAIVELLGHTGFADFRIPADASLADYHRLASRWLRWWEATTARLRSGPGGIRSREGETEKTREGALRGLDWLKRKK